MKVTNYELSKKLQEIGFKAEHEKCWIKFDGQSEPELKTGLTLGEQFSAELIVPVYDFETLLDALPSEIRTDRFPDLLLSWTIKRNAIFYSGKHEFGDMMLFIETFQEGVRVDAVARLIIQLHEQGLIKFGE